MTERVSVWRCNLSRRLLFYLQRATISPRRYFERPRTLSSLRFLLEFPAPSTRTQARTTPAWFLTTLKQKKKKGVHAIFELGTLNPCRKRAFLYAHPLSFTAKMQRE